MLRFFLSFIKNTYILFLVLLVVVLFFWGYNTYLVDRSLANLRFILEKVTVMKDNIGDAKKIALILDAMFIREIAARGDVSVKPEELKAAEKVLREAKQTPQLEQEARQLKDALQYAVTEEITKREGVDRQKIMLEMVNGILTNPKSLSQLEDAKFALKEAIQDKEQKRPAFLTFIDKIASVLLPQSEGMPRGKLEDQAALLKRQLNDIQENDKLQKAVYELANVFTQLNDFENAKIYYKRVIALQPSSHLAEKSLFNLAWNAKTVGNLDEALEGFQVLGRSTSDRELQSFLKFQIADILRKQGKYEESISLLQEISEKDPSIDFTQLANYLVGQVYLYGLGDTEKAKGEFQKAKSLDQSTDIAQFINKQADDSIIEKYLINGFNFLKQAYFMSIPDKYSDAMNNFDRALEIDPKSGLAYAGKSLIFLWFGEREKALELSKKAVRLLPDSEVTCVNLAYIYIELKMMDEAITELKQFIAVRPKSWQAQYDLGFAYVVKNNFAEAAKAFGEASKINPGSAKILNNQGWCMWKLGRYADAIHFFEQAVFVEPHFQDSLFNLGLIYKTSGRYEEARSRLNELLRVAPGYPQLDYQLSDLNKIMRVESSSSSDD